MLNPWLDLVPHANNESSEIFDIIKHGRRVKIKGLQAVKCQ